MTMRAQTECFIVRMMPDQMTESQGGWRKQEPSVCLRSGAGKLAFHTAVGGLGVGAAGRMQKGNEEGSMPFTKIQQGGQLSHLTWRYLGRALHDGGEVLGLKGDPFRICR